MSAKYRHSSLPARVYNHYTPLSAGAHILPLSSISFTGISPIAYHHPIGGETPLRVAPRNGLSLVVSIDNDRLALVAHSTHINIANHGTKED